MGFIFENGHNNNNPIAYASITGNVTRIIVITLGGVNIAERTKIPTVTPFQLSLMRE